jgi:hypothetical protein
LDRRAAALLLGLCPTGKASRLPSTLTSTLISPTHTQELRDVPWYGTLSLLQKPQQYRGGDSAEFADRLERHVGDLVSVRRYLTNSRQKKTTSFFWSSFAEFLDFFLPELGVELRVRFKCAQRLRLLVLPRLHPMYARNGNHHPELCPCSC